MEKEILKEKAPEASAVQASAASTPAKGFFCFLCRGDRAAYKKIERFIKEKTAAKLIFQRFSRNYLSVSEIKAEAVFPREAGADEWPDSLPGCFLNYGKPERPNGPCESCKVQKLCEKSRGLKE